MGGIDHSLKKDEDFVASILGGDGSVVQFGVEADQRGLAAVGDAVNHVVSKISLRCADEVELEAGYYCPSPEIVKSA